MFFLLSIPGGGEFLLILIYLSLLLIPAIFFILTLKSTLESIAPENRMMPPLQVWLLLIPIFGCVWLFVVVHRMSDSIMKEAKSKKIRLGEYKPAYNIGIAMCVFNVICIFIPFFFLAPIACWIAYWIKIAGYKKKIVFHNNFYVTNSIAKVSETESE